MACCGKASRSPFEPRASGPEPAPALISLGVRRQRGALATLFEYTGPTRLAVRSPGTGATYLFEGTGARLRVDPGDALSLATVPGLRAVLGDPPTAPARPDRARS